MSVIKISVLGPAWGVGTSGKWEEVRKGCKKMNIVQILCIHILNEKMILVETVPGIGKGR
jgi:hypothetical protein